MYTSVTWQYKDIFVFSINRTPGFSQADNLKSEAKFD